MNMNVEPQTFSRGFMTWVSQRNPHIALSDIEYLMDMSFPDGENFMTEEVCEGE